MFEAYAWSHQQRVLSVVGGGSDIEDNILLGFAPGGGGGPVLKLAYRQVSQRDNGRHPIRIPGVSFAIYRGNAVVGVFARWHP